MQEKLGVAAGVAEASAAEADAARAQALATNTAAQHAETQLQQALAELAHARQVRLLVAPSRGGSHVEVVVWLPARHGVLD